MSPTRHWKVEFLKGRMISFPSNLHEKKKKKKKTLKIIKNFFNAKYGANKINCR